jgi:transposase-like protein
MSSTKKQRKNYDAEYKRRIVQEYIQGEIATKVLAEREGLDPSQIYHWKVQLAEQARSARIETIATTSGVSMEQARKIRDLEEELAATQKKLAQLAVENELLGELVKKTDPSSPYARRSSSYADIKIALVRSKGRVK